ncbi:MAG: hydroxymyristoyl-ACP dehydratase [Dokdonella sp.]|uniref:hydroxymyristoyl-ACP dehydratase n=1 Tax=Dokdonella sp. TaxID=2291710 RepID=UPI0025BBC965|nr:hydroxymyristoyl-ACP dehydratase [Dokdonella sp.]MBZ0221922.1 hydroxymyristoyl-ACP dehydratase [Dokdonella sp.]
MNEARQVSAPLCIASDHPTLPGHFPGWPVVPGVVLLDAIAALAESSGLGALRRISTLKFLAPALPMQALDMSIECVGSRTRFQIRRDGEAILRGEGEFA